MKFKQQCLDYYNEYNRESIIALNPIIEAVYDTLGYHSMLVCNYTKSRLERLYSLYLKHTDKLEAIALRIGLQENDWISEYRAMIYVKQIHKVLNKYGKYKYSITDICLLYRVMPLEKVIKGKVVKGFTVLKLNYYDADTDRYTWR